MKCVKYFFIIFFLLCHFPLRSHLAYPQDEPPKESITNIVESFETINNYATKGEISHCSCSIHPESFLSKAKKFFQDKYLTLQGKGVSVGVDGHVGLSGANFNIEALKFGNIFTLFIPQKGLRFALYCVGGAGGGTDLNATLDLNEVHTFGKCDSPDDYAGGFLNIGIQAETGVTSLAGKSSISFNIKKFLEIFKKSFSTEKKRQELRQQIYLFLASETDNWIINSLLETLFPTLKPSIKTKNRNINKEQINFDKDSQEDIIQSQISKIETILLKNRSRYCQNTDDCSTPAFFEFMELMEILKQSLGHCHGISGGFSIGPSLALPVTTLVSYTDYALVSTVDINLADLGTDVVSLITQYTNSLWKSSNSCQTLSPQEENNQNIKIKSIEDKIKNIVNLHINSENLKEECWRILANAIDPMTEALIELTVK